jgi:hypothetical protein
MKRSLLLNYNGEPLQFINEVRAIKLLLSGRVDIPTGKSGELSLWQDVFTASTYSIQLPAILRLKYYVVKKVGRKPPRFQKRVLFNRDAWSCQYCNVKLNHEAITVDHIIPVCRGGLTTWRNCVAACKECNRKKGSMMLEEANMKPLKQPSEPTRLHFWDLSKSSVWHQDWSLFVSI